LGEARSFFSFELGVQQCPPFPLGEARSFLVLKTWRVATPPFSFGQGSLVFSLIEGYIVYCWLEA
jgi:hypothetical protein